MIRVMVRVMVRVRVRVSVVNCDEEGGGSKA